MAIVTKYIGGLSKTSRLVELVLIVGLAILSANIFLLLFAPLPLPNRPALQLQALAPAEIEEASNPFMGMDDTALAQEVVIEDNLQETKLDLKLFGVWIDGDQSSATIKTPDGKQGVFRLGDKVWNNSVLHKVRSNQAVIRTAGVLETISLPKTVGKNSTDIDSATPLANSSGNRAALAAAITDIVSIRSRREKDGSTSLLLYSKNNAELFENVGLRNGDKLVSVFGQRVTGDPTALKDLMVDLQGQDAVDLIVERDGEEMPLTVEMTQAVDEAYGDDD